MRILPVSLGLTLVLEVACSDEREASAQDTGSSTGTSTTGPVVGSGTGSSSESGTTGEGVVPEPCSESRLVDVYEPDFEPNDAPHQATDLCTVDSTGVWTVSAELGGDDSIDYFVFRTAGDTGIISFRADLCWEPAMNVTLFDITDGERVTSWASSSAPPACQEAPSILPAGKTFLLEVREPDDAPLASPSPYAW